LSGDHRALFAVSASALAVALAVHLATAAGDRSPHAA
jgi:hypothetical protein